MLSILPINRNVCIAVAGFCTTIAVNVLLASQLLVAECVCVYRGCVAIASSLEAMAFVLKAILTLVCKRYWVVCAAFGILVDAGLLSCRYRTYFRDTHEVSITGKKTATTLFQTSTYTK
jgi:hypothetical protein